MGEWNPFKLSDFEWEVLQLYIKYGYGDRKLYDTLFFCASLCDETALMTLQEFADKAVDHDNNLWKDKNVQTKETPEPSESTSEVCCTDCIYWPISMKYEPCRSYCVDHSRFIPK